MEVEPLNVYIHNNYPIMMSSSSSEHHGNIYASSTYNYQFPNDNLVWNSPEVFVNQSDLSAISSNSFYCPSSSNLNSTTSDENQTTSSSIENCEKSKRGRKKGSQGRNKPEESKKSKKSSKRSESPASPTVMKKRRLAANARERRRMNGLNTAFDR